MEFSLHRQLKHLYADPGASIEASLQNYRIDVIRNGELIEIQHASLAAIQDKVGDLVQEDRVLVVKPIVLRKRLVKQDAKRGRVLSRRLSPKRGRAVDLFDDLVYFTRVFPHPNLSLEAPLIDIEEWRYPGHGRRRWRRRTDEQVEDQKLIELHRIISIHNSVDLLQLIPDDLPCPFHTGHLAESMEVPRRTAQRVAYCLESTGVATRVGKEGNTHLYRLARESSKSVR